MKRILVSVAILCFAATTWAMEDPNGLKSTREIDEKKDTRLGKKVRLEEPKVESEKKETKEEQVQYISNELKSDNKVVCIQNEGLEPMIMRIRCGEKDDISTIVIGEIEKVNAETIKLDSGVRIEIELHTITFPLRIRVFRLPPANLDIEKAKNPTQEQLDYYKEIGLSQDPKLTAQDKTIVLGLNNLNLSMFKATETSYENLQLAPANRSRIVNQKKVEGLLSKKCAYSLMINHSGDLLSRAAELAKDVSIIQARPVSYLKGSSVPEYLQ